MSDTSSRRIVYLDYLRVIATFGVILIHVCAKGYVIDMGSYNWYLNVIGDSLARWAVPVFFMISGTLFLDPGKEVTIRSILRKYIPRLALAYVFWWVFYSAFCITGDWLRSGVFVSRWLQPYVHLWFLPMLMGVYLLIPLLRKIASDDKLLRYSLIIWIIYIFGSFVFEDEFQQITELFRLTPLIGYAGFFLLGRYLSLASFDYGHRFSIYVLGIVGALIGVGGNLILSLKNVVVSCLFLEYLSPHVILMSMAVFVFVKEHADRWSRHLTDYVKDDLFGVYLIHAMWLIVINQDIVRDFCNQIITLPLITVMIFILSLYCTKLIRLIPVLRNVVR
ncbi:MAG: acyltransferase family protein [Bacteroidaceae bacterium]|nr:acyltransferase family protein [Bacteroidaceae bacterium]